MHICFGCFILLQVYGLVQYTAVTKMSLRSDALPVPDTQGLSFGISDHLFTISAIPNKRCPAAGKLTNLYQIDRSDKSTNEIRNGVLLMVQEA